MKEGLAPLLNTLYFTLRRVKERLRLSYQKSSPSCKEDIPIMERGIMGVRVLVTGLKSPKTEAKIEAFEN